MNFITDQQTLTDLSIFSKKWKTFHLCVLQSDRPYGRGAELLEQMVPRSPVEQEAINRRSAIFRHFLKLKLELPFLPEWFDAAPAVSRQFDERTRLTHEDNTLKRKLSTMIRVRHRL